MAKIFISYRRDDTGFAADRLYELLNGYFDKDGEVFIDIDNIPPGVDFVTHLSDRVSQCETALVLIGKDWLEQQNGARRIDDPDDFVRIEIASALKRGVPVVPVLFGGATMPTEDELPELLKPLARRNAFEIHRSSFESDTERLMERLEYKKPKPASAKTSSTIYIFAGVLFLITMMAVIYYRILSPQLDPVAPIDGSASKTPRLGVSVFQNGEKQGLEIVRGDDGYDQAKVVLSRSAFDISVSGVHWDDENDQEPSLSLAISNRDGLFNYIVPHETVRDDSIFSFACAGARYEFGGPNVWAVDYKFLMGNVPCGFMVYQYQQFDEVTASERRFRIAEISSGDNANIIETAERIYLLFYIEDGETVDLNSHPDTIDFYEIDHLEIEFME